MAANEIAEVWMYFGKTVDDAKAKYKVLDIRYNYRQSIDSHGRAVSRVAFGTVVITLEAGNHVDLIMDWMASHTAREYILLTFGASGSITKRLTLEDAFCHSYDEHYSHDKPIPSRLTIMVNSPHVEMNGANPVTEGWYDPQKNRKSTEVTTVQHGEETTTEQGKSIHRIRAEKAYKTVVETGKKVAEVVGTGLAAGAAVRAAGAALDKGVKDAAVVVGKVAHLDKEVESGVNELRKTFDPSSATSSSGAPPSGAPPSGATPPSDGTPPSGAPPSGATPPSDGTPPSGGAPSQNNLVGGL